MTVNDKRGQLEVSGYQWPSPDKNPSPWRARECQNAGCDHDSDPSDWPVARSPAEQNYDEPNGVQFHKMQFPKKTDSSNYKSHSLFMFSFHVMCYVWGNRMVFGLCIEETGETQQLLKEKWLLYLWKPSDTTPNFL